MQNRTGERPANAGTRRRQRHSRIIRQSDRVVRLVRLRGLQHLLASVFFPSGSQTAQLLNTAGIFAVGFLVRPLGGWMFGRLRGTGSVVARPDSVGER